MATRKRANSKSTKKKSTRGKSSQRKWNQRKSSKKKSTRKTGRKAARKTSKRTLIAPKGDKRYVRRTKRGRFKESDEVSRSLSKDVRKRAKRKAPPGQGDKGD